MEIGALITARLAERVYDINNSTSDEFIYSNLLSDIGDNVKRPNQTLKGLYGVGVAKIKARGGLFLLGKNKYKGDAFLIFRGTQLLIDWGSNIDIATRSTSSGHVHAGFYKAMSSMKDQIRVFIQEALKSGVVRFHCIGHSLGGAIAMLCADWLGSASP